MNAFFDMDERVLHGSIFCTQTMMKHRVFNARKLKWDLDSCCDKIECLIQFENLLVLEVTDGKINIFYELDVGKEIS
jgi:hypothetical protein